MNHAKKVDILRQYQVLNRKIDVLCSELEEQKAEEIALKQACKEQGKAAKTEEMMEHNRKLWHLQASIGRQIAVLMQLRAYFGRAISRLEDEKLIQVLRRRYLLGESYEQIAQHMQYSWRWVQKLHQRALDKICLDELKEECGDFLQDITQI